MSLISNEWPRHRCFLQESLGWTLLRAAYYSIQSDRITGLTAIHLAAFQRDFSSAVYPPVTTGTRRKSAIVCIAPRPRSAQTSLDGVSANGFLASIKMAM
jgi:hypothetical protein